jgi:branched-chain amino acid transport system substrate-binding protein
MVYPTIKAAELVVKDINAKGGVLGKQVELLVEDDVCKPEVATNTATKLVSEDAHVVLGHICSGATKAALGIYKDSNIGHVAVGHQPRADPERRLPQLFPHHRFRRCPGPPGSGFRAGRPETQKDRRPPRQGRLRQRPGRVRQSIPGKRAPGRSGLYEGVTPGAVDYSAVVQKIKKAKAEAVIFGGYHPEASKIVTQMRKKKMDTIFISDDGVKDDTFIKVAQKYAEGVYATGPMDVQ